MAVFKDKYKYYSAKIMEPYEFKESYRKKQVEKDVLFITGKRRPNRSLVSLQKKRTHLLAKKR